MSDLVQVTVERDFRPHVEFMHGSWVHMQHYEEMIEGRYYSLLSSLLLSAFAFEAYLNYVGPTVEKGWSDFERVGVWIKLRHVCGLLDINVATDKGAFQTVRTLFDFRNGIAHARPKVIRRSCKDHADHYRKNLQQQPMPQEFDFITKRNAKRCYNAVRATIDLINSHLQKPDDLVWSSMWSYHTGLENK